MIGAGAAGTAVARAFASLSLEPGVLVCRTLASARRAARAVGSGRPRIDPVAAAASARWVVLGLPGDRIEAMARTLAASGRLLPGTRVLHLDGARGREVLGPLERAGCLTAAAHPLLSFPDREVPPEALRGALWGIDAAPRFYSEVARLVRRLGGRPFRVPRRSRLLYHAAGVLAANHAVVQASWAARVLERAGIPRRETLRGLLPLLSSAVRALERKGLPAAITGPAARGDLELLASQERALARLDPGLAEVYRLCAKEAWRLGRAKRKLSHDG